MAGGRDEERGDFGEGRGNSWGSGTERALKTGDHENLLGHCKDEATKQMSQVLDREVEQALHSGAFRGLNMTFGQK